MDCIYIGIDFGTTFSGVAWALSRQPDNIKVVTKWRARGAYQSDDAKTPTELLYVKSRYSNTRSVLSWGYDIDPTQQPLKYFKLCLEDERNLAPDVQKSEQLETARRMLATQGVTAVEASADYLRELWKATLECLERELGANSVKGLPFRVVVTVPAMWSDAAKNRTLEAAKKAGIAERRLCGETTLDLVPEPEAAALATLASFKGRPNVHSGDVITVCDCGGGTVDITSYKIENPDPVTIKESVGNDGKMCGGIFVDIGFQEFVKGRVQKRWNKLSPELIRKIMNDEWENGIKRTFDGDGRDFSITLPAEAAESKLFHGRRTFSLPLTGKMVESIFNPVLGKIQNLVQNQVQQIQTKEGKLPKCIMLVGGFGRCSYLYAQLKEVFGPKGILKPSTIDILQTAGEEPWTAICRGAVIRAMSGQGFGPVVTTRVAKRNYGLAFYQKFVPGFHLIEDKAWIASEGDYMADNQMRWYLRKGMDIATQNPVRMGFYTLLRSSDEIQSGHLNAAIYVSEANNAANRKTRGVTKLCEIKIQLDTTYYNLPIHVNNVGVNCRKISYEVEMTCSGGLISFAAIVNGVRQPSQNVETSFM